MDDKRIPTAVYPCHFCREDYSWPADDLHWSEVLGDWVCYECWQEHDCGERGCTLAEELGRRPDPRLAEMEAERDRLKHLLAHYSDLAEEVGIDTSAIEHGQCAFAAERDRLAGVVSDLGAVLFGEAEHEPADLHTRLAEVLAHCERLRASYESARDTACAALEARNEALAEAARLREDCAALTEMAASRLADAEALRAIMSVNAEVHGRAPARTVQPLVGKS